MNIQPNDIPRMIHENTGYWDGHADASKGRMVEATDHAYFRGYRLGPTNGPVLNEFTNWKDHPELSEE